MTFQKQHDDRYESALDDVIAQCGGDLRGALKALLAANEYLETELCSLHAAIETGAVPSRLENPSRNRLN